MNPLLIAPLLEFGKGIIDRFIPNETEKQKAELDMVKLMAAGSMQQVMAQLQINLAEAQSPRLWVSGWRPYFGWVGGTAFMYVGLLKPLLSWLSLIKGWPVPPDVDTEFLWVVVSGLLGIGTLRTVDKVKGVSK